MTIWQAMVLGVVQGVTEFLPVSSSGHLILVPELFGWSEQGLDFDVMIHVATLAAILWVLRDDIKRTFVGMFGKKVDDMGMLGWKIVVATLPVVFVGFTITDEFLDVLRSTTFVAVALIVWGIVLFFADRYAHRNSRAVNRVEKTSWRAAIMTGCFQVMALMPGTSRSGATITGALLGGLDRKTAARFSFLLSIPAIGGAGFLVLTEAVQAGFSTPTMPLIVGFFSAFISGILAIRFLLSFLEKASFGWFAGYRILLGIVILLVAYL